MHSGDASCNWYAQACCLILQTAAMVDSTCSCILLLLDPHIHVRGALKYYRHIQQVMLTQQILSSYVYMSNSEGY